jgi:hypothetical protein
MVIIPLILAVMSPASSQGLTAPPIVQPSVDMAAALAKEGFAPSPPNLVAMAASCRAAGNYFLAAGDGRVLSVIDALNKCWRRRKSSSRHDITIRRWSQPRGRGSEKSAASSLRAIVITNEAFTLLTFGTDLGKGD